MISRHMQVPAATDLARTRNLARFKRVESRFLGTIDNSGDLARAANGLVFDGGGHFASPRIGLAQRGIRASYLLPRTHPASFGNWKSLRHPARDPSYILTDSRKI